MKLFKFVLPLVFAAVSFSASAAFAVCGCTSSIKDDLDENDFDAVVEFLQSKRTINLQEKSGNLSFSGDVRTSWANTNEKIRTTNESIGWKNGQVNLRGGGARDGSGKFPQPKGNGTTTGARIPRGDFDVEFNLNFDYKCDRAWAVAKLQFDNSMGISESNKTIVGDNLVQQDTLYGTNCQPANNYSLFGSGACDDTCLKKAYIGYNVCTDGCSRFDIELGRRRFYDVFDSQVEFHAQFDGILFRYGTQMDCCSDAYVNLGGFVVDSRSHHFGWVIESGMLNICDSGVDLKYSFIDWRQKSDNRAGKPGSVGSDFQVSQFLGYYHFDPEILCMPAKLYAAVLYNSAANKNDVPDGEAETTVNAGKPDQRIVKSITGSITNRKRCPWGWYIGATFGEVAREGDWAVNINYQYVQAQAVPDADVHGIGRGNVLKQQLTQFKEFGVVEGIGSVAYNSRGNANYKGWKIEGLYALTDDLSLDASFQMSRSVDKNIGGHLNYNPLKLAAIYAF